MTSSRSTESDSVAGALMLSTYALVVATGGMASLAGHSPVWLALTVLACAAHGIFAGPEEPYLIPDGLADILSGVAFLLGLSEYWLLGLSLTICMSHFLTAVAMLVLFRRKQESHYRLMRLTVIIVTAIAATTAETWIFLLSFLGAAGVLIWNHIARDVSASMEDGGDTTDRLSLAGGSVGVGLAALFCAWLVYLGYPRVSALQLRDRRPGQQRQQQGQTRIGFTESDSPGQIDTRAGGEELVMEVRFSVSGSDRSSIQPPILMRGQVMGIYSDGSWEKHQSRPSEGRRFYRTFNLEAVPRLARSTYILEGIPYRPRRILQRIRVRTSDTRVLFSLPRPVWASVDGNAEVGFDPVTHVLYTGTTSSAPRTYRVFSLRPRVPRSSLQGAVAAPPESVNTAFLQVPADLKSELKENLARIRERYDTGSDYALVKAIERYLRDSGRFNYTLAGPEMAGMDPIQAFLGRTRSGSCTHFASAMALMLRSRGIPARLVVGFRGGEKGEDELTRRFYQKHAHAWVEVAFEDYGWLPFDPTPGGLGGDDTLSSAMSELARILRGPRGSWFYIFVGYGKRQQQEILQALGRAASAGFEQLGGAVSQIAGGSWSGSWLAALLLAGLIGIFVLFWILRRITWFRARRGELPVEFYQRAMALLQEKGVHRPSHLTAREFAERVDRRLPDENTDVARAQDALRRLTELYYEVRYGARSLTEQEREEVERRLSALSQACSTRA